MTLFPFSHGSVTESVQRYVQKEWRQQCILLCILQSTGTYKADYYLFLECPRSVGQSSLWRAFGELLNAELRVEKVQGRLKLLWDSPGDPPSIHILVLLVLWERVLGMPAHLCCLTKWLKENKHLWGGGLPLIWDQTSSHCLFLSGDLRGGHWPCSYSGFYCCKSCH